MSFSPRPLCTLLAFGLGALALTRLARIEESGAVGLRALLSALRQIVAENRYRWAKSLRGLSLPRAGHEQGGRRPAVVISRRDYNERTGLMLACSITSKVKGYAFEVPIAAGTVEGVALADHVRSLDWRARRAELIRADSRVADDVAALVIALIASED